MEKDICKDYSEKGMGIEALAYKYHVGKLKIKKMLTDNGIEIRKKGNQKSEERFVVSDWKFEKYEPVDGMEYIVYDPNTEFKTKDIKNNGGLISSYLKKAYNLKIPTLYDRRKYYMQTGNYWWEQWLSVKSVPVGSVSVKQKDWAYAGKVEDNIDKIVSNRIRDAKKECTFIKKTAKASKMIDGVKKTRQELFIEKARIAHPNENLDYSQSVYVDKSTPVYIIDHDLRPDGTEYGGYWQRPENHLRGTGHPDKFRDRLRERKTSNWDEMVARFKKAHPDENIEYPPQENYTGLTCKIRFIDHDLRPDGTEYGEIWQIASEHLKGRKHSRKYFDSRIGTAPVNKKTREGFIEECNKKHNNFYSYDKIVYKGRRTMVTVTCPIHGDFEILAENHIAGHGCPKCANVYRYTNNEFKKKIHEIHGNKYDLTEVEYVNSKTKVMLICPEHGRFEISPNKLLAGQGCYVCGREKLYNTLRYTRDEVVDKANKIHHNRYTYNRFTEYKNNTSLITATCPIHGDFKQTVASHLAGCGCPGCFATHSKSETEIYEYVKSLGFDVTQGDRNVLEGLEIDVYIPQKKVGIEFNGLYWHSEGNGKDSHYHLNKTLKAKEKGIKLIQVFEDEWLQHKDIVLSKIRHILGADKERIKIGARKCVVREITNVESEIFLEKWHIQGFGKSTIYYGAYYNDVLVGVMSFKYSENKWELTRFASHGEYSVPGLGGKIFKKFVNDKNPSYVKSFADRRWTLDEKNNLYTKIGFVVEEVSRPDYRYVVGNERKHKFGFRKQVLHKKYGVPLEWTEKEMCDALGFYRIWDCGLFKYVWKKKDNNTTTNK